MNNGLDKLKRVEGSGYKGWAAEIRKTEVEVVYGPAPPHRSVQVYPAFIEPDRDVEALSWVNPYTFYVRYHMTENPVTVLPVFMQKKQRNKPGFVFYHPDEAWRGASWEPEEGWIAHPVIGAKENPDSANRLKEGIYNALVLADLKRADGAVIHVPEDALTGNGLSLNFTKAMLCAVAQHGQDWANKKERPSVSFFFDTRFSNRDAAAQFARTLNVNSWHYAGRSLATIPARIATLSRE